MYVLIKNNVVHGKVDCTLAVAQQITASGEYTCVYVPNNAIPNNGTKYINGQFVQIEQPPIYDIPQIRKISVGSFYDRFGSSKYAILASTDPSIRALIEDCKVRSYIDLDHPSLRPGLQMIVNAGYSIDIDSIVGTDPTPSEIPK